MYKVSIRSQHHYNLAHKALYIHLQKAKRLFRKLETPHLVTWYPLADVSVTGHPPGPIGFLSDPLGHVWLGPHPGLWLWLRGGWRGWGSGCDLWLVIVVSWILWGILERYK